jgi:thioredoxin 1
MNKTARIGIVVALLVVAGAVMAIKQKNREASRAADATPNPALSESRPAETTEAKGPAQKKAVPRLVDLGAGKCIPCKKMAPILEELRKEFAGRLDVEFIDVWENPSAGELYRIKLIPTQIFYDASGKELFRHEGFFSREDILGKWKELGVNLQNTPVSG